MFKDLNEAIDITRALELSKHEYADRLEAIALGDFANGVRESAENFGQIAEWLCQLAEMKDILREDWDSERQIKTLRRYTEEK